jgi:hypothetical protein
MLVALDKSGESEADIFKVSLFLKAIDDQDMLPQLTISIIALLEI